MWPSLKLIGCDQSYDLLLKILFRWPEVPGHRDVDEQANLLSAISILATYEGLSPGPIHQAVQRAAAKYTSKAISKRFRQFFGEDVYCQHTVLPIILLLCRDFASRQDISRKFRQDGLHISLINQAWAWLRHVHFWRGSIQFAEVLCWYVRLST